MKASGCSVTISCCQGSNAMVRSCFLPGPCWGKTQGQCLEVALISVHPSRWTMNTPTGKTAPSAASQ